MHIKSILLTSIIIVLLFSYSPAAVAGNYPEKGSFGVSINDGNRLLIKSMLTDEVALSVGMNLARYKTGSYERITSNFILGIRKYRKKGPLNHFYDLNLHYSYRRYSYDNPASSSDWSQSIGMEIYYGLEHFIYKTVSIEGGAGIDITDEGDDSGYITLPITNLALTYYW